MVNTESKHKKKTLYVGDFVAVGVVLLLSFFVWLSFFLQGKSDGQYVRVIEDSDRVVLECELGHDREYEVTSENGYTLRLKVYDGVVSVVESGCPNGYCRSSGNISKNGEVIVCAPAHLKIKIVSGGESDESVFIVG